MHPTDRDDDPEEAWTYRDHECRVYASEDPVDGETVWAGYVHTSLPDAGSYSDSELAVPGELTTDVEDGWVGFSVSGGSRDAEQASREVEQLVDQVVELEATMDG